MYVIDLEKRMIKHMRAKELSEFLNAVMVHNIGHFCFADTKEKAGNMLMSLMINNKKGRKTVHARHH